GPRLDAEGMEDFLAGEHRMLRLFARIRAGRMGLWADFLHTQAVQGTRVAEYGLAQRQRSGGLVPAVMVNAPERALAVELLEHGENDPRGVVHQRRITTPVVGHQQ